MEEQGLRSRERSDMEPRFLYLCSKNNDNFNDHQWSYNSYTFRDHAGLKHMGNRYNTSLPEDRYKVWMMDYSYTQSGFWITEPKEKKAHC